MADSPIHLLLNDIRIKYSGKKCSMLDIRQIENQYNICSILNTRSNGVAFLRITSFGLKQIVFEDICLNSSSIIDTSENSHNYIFNLNKALYEIAYGIELEDSNQTILKEYMKPSVDFYTMNEEIKNLKEKCEEFEKKINEIKDLDNRQMSLF